MRRPVLPRWGWVLAGAGVLAVVLAVALVAGLVVPSSRAGSTVPSSRAGSTVPSSPAGSAVPPARQPAVTPPPLASSGWQLVLDEEFDGTALDGTRWQADRGSGDAGARPFNPEMVDSWFSPADAQVTGGQLVLSVRPEPRRLGDLRFRYSSGMVQTTTAVVRPGDYVEARLRIPGCSGCWPAFWLLPTDHWPPEIDVAEFGDTGAQRRPDRNYFDEAKHEAGLTPYGDEHVDYRNAFHTYGLLWTGSRLVPYLDGVARPEAAVTGAITPQPMRIVLDLAVLQGAEIPAGTQLRVDQVRVWRTSSTG